MPKIKLSHRQENGFLATRTTARAYTCVLLVKHNNAVRVAALEANRQVRIDYAVKSARRDFKDNMDDIAAGPGGQIRYKRGQGGYRKFADGTSYAMYTQEQWHFDHVMEYHKLYGETLEGYIAHFTKSAMDSLNHEIDSARNRSEDWYVVSWHGNPKNAKSSYANEGDTFKVEAINGGVR